MAESIERHLPVYLMLDCSGSMAGQRIEALRQGVKALLVELRSDPQALETALLSVISFDSGARQHCRLTDLMSFQEPRLEANGSTALGKALAILEECIDREVRKSSAQQKGDWKPIVFLMTDGDPTDEWEAAADQIKRRQLANVIACSAGNGVDERCLKRLTDTVVKLDDLGPDTLKSFFSWVSTTVKVASLDLAQTGNDTIMRLPQPPMKIEILP